jgi:hypothetical protein
MGGIIPKNEVGGEAEEWIVTVVNYDISSLKLPVLIHACGLSRYSGNYTLGVDSRQERANSFSMPVVNSRL